MRRIPRRAIASFALVAMAGARCPPEGGRPPVVEYAGAAWFDGSSFEERDFWVRDGILYESPPAQADSTVDLAGKFVIPPFGEAHAHLVAQAEELPPTMAMGLFDPARQRQALDSIKTSRVGEQDSYFRVDSLGDLERQWDRILDGSPDGIKIYLLDSERYDLTIDDDEYMGRRGLDPALVEPIVTRAHGAGLPVAAHVETAFDFGVAARSGVDQVAHLPGYGASTLRSAPRSRYEIDVADARAGAEGGMVVSATVSMAAAAASDSTRFRDIQELQRDNLRVLLDAGVGIVVGSDANGFSFQQRAIDARHEALYLRALGVVPDPELLRIWVEDTPRSIFPDRMIGRLADGFEASFLVLGGNPLDDWSMTDSIELRVKNGHVMER